MVEIKGFRYRVDARLQITKSELEHMIECSAKHYDGVCIAASRLGGFLYGWRIQLDLDECIIVWADWNIADTLCKILEMEQHMQSELHLWFPCVQILKRLGDESERVNKDPQLSVNRKGAP